MSKYYAPVNAQVGENQKAMVIMIEVKDNDFYDSSKPESGNNSPTCYNIMVQFENGAQLYQNFVKPAGSGLFADLCNVAGLDLSPSGGEIDEQKLVGTEFMTDVVSNKKGYPSIFNANPVTSKKA